MKIRVLIKNFPYQPVENAVGESFVFLYGREDTEYQTDENWHKSKWQPCIGSLLLLYSHWEVVHEAAPPSWPLQEILKENCESFVVIFIIDKGLEKVQIEKNTKSWS